MVFTTKNSRKAIYNGYHKEYLASCALQLAYAKILGRKSENILREYKLPNSAEDFMRH